MVAGFGQSVTIISMTNLCLRPAVTVALYWTTSLPSRLSLMVICLMMKLMMMTIIRKTS